MDSSTINENSAEFLSYSKIKEIMEKKGECVKAVVLKQNGEMEQVIYDSTPKNCHIKKFIDGSPTIVGEWTELNVIIVMNADQESDKLELNKHKLRYPFNDFSCKGNMFLYRFDENCKVVDFTLDEYQSFVNNAQEDVGKEKFPAFEKPQEEEEEEYDPQDDVNDDEALSDEFLMAIVNRQFCKKFGRLPDDEELKEYTGIVKNTLNLHETEDEDIENDDADDEEYDPKNDENAEEDEDDEDEHEEGDNEENVDENDNGEVAAEEEEEEEEKEPDVSKEEYEEAMANVRKLGKIHQIELVNKLCDRWKNEVGDECELDDILNTFDYIKKRFANEAKSDLEVVNEVNELELSFLKTLKEEEDANKALFAKAKDLVYQNLKSNALKQWEKTHSNVQKPTSNDLNELVQNLAFQLFDNYQKVEDKEEEQEQEEIEHNADESENK